LSLPKQIQRSEEAIVVEPMGASADAAVIWLHGLGADGNDFLGILPELELAADHRIRFIFPNAPVQPVTINGGMQMPFWYDIRSLDFLADFDQQGVNQSVAQISALLEKQIASGIASQRIILAGFSQGGLIALHCGLGYKSSLAGVMALSTYCPNSEQFTQHHNMPILMMHGDQDPVIPLAVAEASKAALLAKGYEIEWHQYAMQHQVCAEQVAEISRWLNQCLPIQ